MQWAFENGIINGTSKTVFSPDNAISREEMATILYRYMTYAGLSSKQKKMEKFKDNDTFSDWAADAINSIKAFNIMSGTGENRFEPKRMSNRAEAAKVIAETLKFSLR